MGRPARVGGRDRHLVIVPSSTPANWRRVLTSLSLGVRGRSRARARNHAAGATHKHRTRRDRAGSGCVPFFAASWKQQQAAGVVLSSLT